MKTLSHLNQVALQKVIEAMRLDSVRTTCMDILTILYESLAVLPRCTAQCHD